MCWACPDALHDRAAKVTLCTIDLQPVVGRRGCPREKFTDDTGITSVLDGEIKIYRVPYWTRLLIWAFNWKHHRPSSYDGCGCPRSTRDLWERFKAEWKALDRGSARGSAQGVP